ncbi:MAG TPA: beta-ketoacyl-[acyl-carrier-protein] synthase family protein [Thermoanaerobaculia bacterium]|jgi:3-oxoacyl-[acyl-carrier-protein] synthase II|nr:beta-ketoacyl-[acyl-carrier-protein] synthase family protein [Thermoanaerobaculia bacterium]
MLTNEVKRDHSSAIRPQTRVVVTGIGIVTPLGHTLDELWQRLLHGPTGVGPITRFDSSRFSCRLAAEVESGYIPDSGEAYLHEVKRMARFVHFGIGAASAAFADAGFPRERIQAADGSGGLFVGVAMGGLGNIEDGVLLQEAKGPRKTTPYLIPSLIPNAATGMIGLLNGFRGPQYTVVGGCASGLQAMGQAMEAIRSGQLSWALAGGSEEVTTPITYSGFQAMGILTETEDPLATPRPFDRTRDGMVVGEGAGMLLLESLESARERGAPILAELTGYATSSVISKAFFSCGDETARCMRLVLDDAGLQPGDVGCILAHAGGLAGDAGEMKAVQEVFPDPGARPALTSTKGHIGYCFAGSGPLDVAAAILALRHQKIFPALNFREAEPELADLEIVAQPVDRTMQHCLINSFGLGGVNASLIVSAEPKGTGHA